MWRYNPILLAPERVKDEATASREDSSAEPSHFDTTDFSKFLQVGKDKLGLKYTGPGDHETDVGCIQANHAVPRHKRIFYYEVKILDAGAKGLISVGFAEKGFNLGKHPGSEQGSYGYCSETGHKMSATSGQQRGAEYGEPYTTGDVVGAGIIVERQEMFFTRNGKNFGQAFGDVMKTSLLPTVGLHSTNEHVQANFSGPFVFNIEQLDMEERQKQAEARQSLDLPSSLCHEVILDYLRHQGYAETLDAFLSSSGMPQPPQEKIGTSVDRAHQEWQSLEQRHELRKLIVSGGAHKARAALHKSMAHSRGDWSNGGVDWLTLRIKSDSRKDFFITCQTFIELIREQKVEEAVQLARESLSTMRGAFPSSEYDTMLHDVVALLAYVQPEYSPLAGLLGAEQREHVADMVNTSIISAGLEDSKERESPLSLLQQLLTQLVSTQLELHTVSGGLGQRFQLSEHLHWMQNRGRAAAPNEQLPTDAHPANGRENGSNGVADMEEDGDDH